MALFSAALFVILVLIVVVALGIFVLSPLLFWQYLAGTVVDAFVGNLH